MQRSATRAQALQKFERKYTPIFPKSASLPIVDATACLNALQRCSRLAFLQDVGTLMHEQQDALACAHDLTEIYADTIHEPCKEKFADTFRELLLILEDLHDNIDPEALRSVDTSVAPLFALHRLVTNYVVDISNNPQDSPTPTFIDRLDAMNSWYQEYQASFDDLYNRIIQMLTSKTHGKQLSYRTTAWGPKVILKPIEDHTGEHASTVSPKTAQDAEKAYNELMAELAREEARKQLKKSLCVSPKAGARAAMLPDAGPASPMSAVEESESTSESEPEEDTLAPSPTHEQSLALTPPKSPLPGRSRMRIHHRAQHVLQWHREPMTALHAQGYLTPGSKYLRSRADQIKMIARHRLPLVLETEYQSWATLSRFANFKRPRRCDIVLTYLGFIKLPQNRLLYGNFVIAINPTTRTPFHRFLHIKRHLLLRPEPGALQHEKTVMRNLFDGDTTQYTMREFEHMVEITDDSDPYKAIYTILQPNA